MKKAKKHNIIFHQRVKNIKPVVDWQTVIKLNIWYKLKMLSLSLSDLNNKIMNSLYKKVHEDYSNLSFLDFLRKIN